jgi:hypothetical protein
LNAIAHIFDGGHPPAHDGDAGRNTILGVGIHTAASIWWAAFYELAVRETNRPLLTASTVSAIAYVVDYYVVHPRLRPGFEAYLSSRALFAVYAALALGFAVSGRKRRARVRQRHDQRKRTPLPRRARQPELAAEQARELAAD